MNTDMLKREKKIAASIRDETNHETNPLDTESRTYTYLSRLLIFFGSSLVVYILPQNIQQFVLLEKLFVTAGKTARLPTTLQLAYSVCNCCSISLIVYLHVVHSYMCYTVYCL